jgi:hypothetical protein
MTRRARALAPRAASAPVAGPPPSAEPPPPPPPPAPPAPPIDLGAATPLDYFVGNWRCDAALPLGSHQHEVDMRVVRAASKGDPGIRYELTFTDRTGVHVDATEYWFGGPGTFWTSSFPSSGSKTSRGEGSSWNGDTLTWNGEITDLNTPACVGCQPSPPFELQAKFTRRVASAFDLEVRGAPARAARRPEEQEQPGMRFVLLSSCMLGY